MQIHWVDVLVAEGPGGAAAACDEQKHFAAALSEGLAGPSDLTPEVRSDSPTAPMVVRRMPPAMDSILCQVGDEAASAINDCVTQIASEGLDVFVENASFSFVDLPMPEISPEEAVTIVNAALGQAAVVCCEGHDEVKGWSSSVEEDTLPPRPQPRPLHKASGASPPGSPTLVRRHRRYSVTDLEPTSPVLAELRGMVPLSALGVPQATPVDQYGQDIADDGFSFVNKVREEQRLARQARQLKLELEGLRDISLKVKRGSLVGVVGRVGAGKSSLLLGPFGFVPEPLACRQQLCPPPRCVLLLQWLLLLLRRLHLFLTT